MQSKKKIGYRAPLVIIASGALLGTLTLVPTLFAWQKAGDFALSGILGELTGVGGGAETSIGWLIVFLGLVMLTTLGWIIFSVGVVQLLIRAGRTEQAGRAYERAEEVGKDSLEHGRRISGEGLGKSKELLAKGDIHRRQLHKRWRERGLDKDLRK